MEALEAILTRRSIRKFKPEQVARELVTRILEAAMAAPSAGNQQSWQFIVLTNRAILDEIPKVHPYAGMIKEAPLAIIVCGDLERELHKGFWIQDCSAAAENLLLAAHALGLGAVWCGLYPNTERVSGLRKLLALPDTVIPLALIPVGYPAEIIRHQKRFDESLVHYNQY